RRELLAAVRRGNRSETSTADHCNARPLGLHPASGLVVIGRFDARLLTGSHLERECALPGLGHHDVRIEAEADLVGETEAVETAGREDDGVETAFPALAQTRIDVPAQGLDRERGLEGEQLCTPSDRRGADAHPRLQGVGTTERIARIL